MPRDTQFDRDDMDVVFTNFTIDFMKGRLQRVEHAADEEKARNRDYEILERLQNPRTVRKGKHF